VEIAVSLSLRHFLFFVSIHRIQAERQENKKKTQQKSTSNEYTANVSNVGLGRFVGAGFIPALTPLAVIIPCPLTVIIPSTVPHGFYIFCGVRAGMNPAPTVFTVCHAVNTRQRQKEPAEHH